MKKTKFSYEKEMKSLSEDSIICWSNLKGLIWIFKRTKRVMVSALHNSKIVYISKAHLFIFH